MIELCWYQAYPPRDAGLAEVTAMLRVLSARPHQGVRRVQPLVVFELWVAADQMRWLLGVEASIARTLPTELAAQLPGLALIPIAEPKRLTPVTAREVRLTSWVFPLRPDNAPAVTAGLVAVRQQLRGDEQVVLSWVIGPSHQSTAVPISTTPLDWLGFTQPRQPDGEERRAWKAKLAEPLFGVRGRVAAVAGDPRRGGELLRPVVSALSLASGPHGRVYAQPASSRVAAQLIRVMGRLRQFSGLVNAAELAALSGWCLGGLDVPGGPGPFAPPPAGLLHAATSRTVPAGSRPLGLATHPAAQGQAVWLPWSSYGVHAHVIGPPGRGKSTLLSHWATAETTGQGSVVVIEPKGDLITDILARLSQGVHERVVVIDPGAEGLAVTGFNPLAGSRADAERRADTILGLLREVFGSAIGPRSADVLWHATLMAARLDDGALTDVPMLLTNPVFRRSVAAKVSDPLTIGPWLAWYDHLSDDMRAQVIQPVLNKLRPWTARPAIRRLLGQASPKFELVQVFERPTVLLVVLNPGAIGSETAKLMGSLLLSQLWQLVQHQTTLPPAQRRPVSVVLDEFQIYAAGLDFADVLARARGANVSFTAAHQHLGQLGSDLQAAVLANVGARMVFRPADNDRRTLARVLGAPVKSDDLDQLAAYHAVARVLVDGAPGRAFEVATPPLPDALHDAEALRRASAQRYGTDPAELDALLLARWQGGGPPEGPVGLRRTAS